MPEYSCLQQKSFVRGLNASTDLFDQPRGSVPRGSNLILSKRGALKACDGTQIVNAYQGVPTAGRGKGMSSVLFQPIGVSPYYLLLAKALDQPLGPPNGLAGSASGSGGTLATGTYFYKVTAIDGVGGETTASNELAVPVTLGQKPNLTWNVVPNASGYNVYRSTSAGFETLLAGNPIAQPNIGTNTVSFVDGGLGQAAVAFPLLASPNGCTAFISQVNTGFTTIFHTLFTFNVTGSLPNLTSGAFQFTIAGSNGPNGTFDATYGGTGINGNTIQSARFVDFAGLSLGTTAYGGGGILTIIAGISPPVVDTTQQSALFKMPSGISGIVSYDNSNIVALFPADAQISGIPGGGSGGGGTSGKGTSGPSGSTASGGLRGNISNIPQMQQFTNQIAIALGNGFPPQLYSDATGSPDHPAISVPITAISVDASGNVTVTAAHGLTSLQNGANVIIAGVANPAYNTVGPTSTIPDTGHLTIRNTAAIGAGASSGGTLTFTTIPLFSTFTAGYPVWSTSITVLVGDLIVPATPNGHYYKAIQAGVTNATAAPTFPLGAGQIVQDGGGSLVVWQEAGQTNSGAPAPPGAAHIAVYAGSLWVFNTSATNTSNGLDGPTSMRMSDVNNASSWNPINQAFLDKDDGTDGMGLASFTVTAQGIPPEGSLIAAKDFSTYQIIGVFGAANFAIQRIKSDMGCIAPRTLQFVPGFGITRYTHLGFAVFDGVDDKLISEDIRPFLFPINDPDYADITVVDSNWVGVSWGAQVANPPMYAVAMPIGTSGGALTRIFCYDLVLKAWTLPIDLPFPIGNLYQARTEPSNAITLMFSFSDGTFQRWQAGDLQWATSASGSGTPAPVSGYVDSPEVFNGYPMGSQTGRIYIRKVVARGNLVDPSATLTPSLNLQTQGLFPCDSRQYPVGPNGYILDISVNEKVANARARLSFTGSIELDSFGWFVKPMAAEVPISLI